VERIVRALDRFQRTHRGPAFAFAVIKKFGDDQAGALAALIAYYTFFALFPLLLVLSTVLGFALHAHPALHDRLLGSALVNFPVIGPSLKQGTLRGSGIGLVVGFVGLLWAGIGAMRASENAMNTVWNVPRRLRPGFFPSIGRAVLALGVLGGGLVLATALSGVFTWSGSIGPLGRAAGLAGSIVVDTLIFLFAFHVLTRLDLAWSELLPGSILAGVAWGLLQALGSYYIGHALKGASETYGTFGLVIVLLSWLYLQAQVALYAAEVNVVRKRHLWPRGILNDDLTEADVRSLEDYARTEERLPNERVLAVISR
jgi:YihY family inner membrane protein